MKSKNQYLQTLIEQGGYHLKSRRGKTMLLDEYCKNTNQNRKYVIRKIRQGKYIKGKTKQTRKRKSYYDNYVKTALVRCWRIFDRPCGQRLKPLLENETDKLRELKELKCSDTTAIKLKRISNRTIDRKLKHQKEIEHLKSKYSQKKNPLLYQQIPIKIFTEQDRTVLGNIQIDLVEHCGQSAGGQFICTLSNTDISSGWWEGSAIMGKGQERTFKGLSQAGKRFPFPFKEVHSDNGTEFINWHLYHYCKRNNIAFTRSRPYKKNDNCLVEQKNGTHVKRFVGYLRYDTQKELDVINSLYRNKLHFYKNFFQPVIKLKQKIRIKGRVHRKYCKAKTPYQNIMESDEVSDKTKQELKRVYDSLNPAQLKRDIDAKLDKLYKVYQKKNKSLKAGINKKLKPSSVTFLNVSNKNVSVT